MIAYVVDTNVGVVANARDTDASPECVIACTDLLERITSGRARLVLDADWEILKEYMRKMSSSGQPGAGDAFLRWVLNNLANPDRCEQVFLERLEGGGYARFPEDPGLQGFDPSDRKFVAVALGSGSAPQVANAVDSGWWLFREALDRVGVRLKFLCPEEVARARRARRGEPSGAKWR